MQGYASVTLRPLVVHLAEYEVEELPEGSVLWHALIAVDEVVAATEGRPKHLRIGSSRTRMREHVACANGLVARWPVADRLGVDLELRRFLLQKEELEAVGPKPILTTVDRLGLISSRSFAACA